ncbi:MAG TPA: methyl-accepting chemotaxis protein [Terriglobales bacterium]|nr:methyl-accepting chemotaxis protein [Terriglobales bacterium]
MFKNLGQLGNWKIWQKLALVGVAFAILFCIPTVQMIQSMNDGIRTAEREARGLAYQGEVQKLIRQLQMHRLASAGLLSGDQSFRGKVEEAAREIDGAVRAIDEIDQQHGATLGVDSRWVELKDQVRNVISNKTTNAPAALKTENEAIASLVAFVAQVGAASNLVSDPEQHTRYLADATTIAIPEAAELVSRLAAAGMGPAVRGMIDPDERDELLKQFALVNYNTGRLRTAYDPIFQHSEDMRTLIGGAHQAALNMTDRVMSMLENEFLMTREDIVSTSAKNWYDIANNAIDSYYVLYDKSQPAFADFLDQRISERNGEIYGTLGWVLLAALLVSGLGLAIIRGITGPLGNAVEAAKLISAGDLSANIMVVDREDEIGVLTKAFDNMIRTLRSQIQSLTDGIQSLSATTGQIIVALTQVVAGATEAAAAVKDAASTAEEVKHTARLASERSQEVAGSAQQAVRVALDGERSVDDAVQGMTKVREQMESIAESVLKLGERSRAIGEIIAAVNDLAEQSNLLAVNASIEAAKAGEQGRGFAVVAQEVKSLATQSKQATAQVRQMLNDIQKAAGIAVMVTEQGTKSAEAGVKQSIVAGESIRSLAKNIADAAQSVTQITFSSQQQLSGMDRVAGAMDNIKLTTDQNVDSMRQIESAVQSLSEVCATLEELAGRYTLHSNGRILAA